MVGSADAEEAPGAGEGDGDENVIGSARRERVSVKSGGRTSETNHGMSLGL